MENTVRWGIIGLGKIAHSFAQDLALVPQGRLTAVASRTLEKAQAFAREYGADLALGSYEELFDCKEVDVVYVATPHTSHAQWSIAAMDRGKHVLCEKPLGVNLREVTEIQAAAQRNRVFLMEALWSRFNPSIQKVRQLINTGEIGEIGYLHADFAFYALDREENGRLLNPGLAGGSLLDIGIYPIFLAYLILGKPTTIKASSHFYRTGVEIQTAMLFEYPKAQALLFSGFSGNSEIKAWISGSLGSLYLHPRWHQAQGYTLEKGGTKQVVELPTLGKGYTHEIGEVHQCLQSKKMESTLWSHQNSIDLSALLEKVREHCGITFPMEK